MKEEKVRPSIWLVSLFSLSVSKKKEKNYGTKAQYTSNVVLKP